MSQLTKYEQASLDNFEKAIIEGKFSNDALVQFFELTATYLNICTPAEYARQNGLTYNGVKCMGIKTIQGIKYLVNN